MAHNNRVALFVLVKEILEDDLNETVDTSDDIPVMIASASWYMICTFCTVTSLLLNFSSFLFNFINVNFVFSSINQVLISVGINS